MSSTARCLLYTQVCMARKGSFTAAESEMESNGAIHILGRTFLITKTLALAMLKSARSCRCLLMLLLIAQSERAFYGCHLLSSLSTTVLTKTFGLSVELYSQKANSDTKTAKVGGGSRIHCGHLFVSTQSLFAKFPSNPIEKGSIHTCDLLGVNYYMKFSIDAIAQNRQTSHY